MTNLNNQRRIASKVLGCGLNRVWLDPEASEDIAAAITREDIRELVESGNIKSAPVKGVSRGRARARDAKRKYGHRKGHGSRKGKKGARNPRKEQWMKKIRALRRRLKELRDDGTLDRSTYCKVYRKAKGGEYRSVAHLEAHLDIGKDE
ncbi:50S ribosomal protein L19e [Methanohalophilus halophilus]|uniref:Large ribosomal subunit protein eL19 n=1 Tax=Methanohalophilus halophilus TaxID=2177 RepID=A0A1L3Q2Y8_9EURY|nr:50S ribosomal protein L19e [Methanohalophilus halophilus]APH39244.1 50S ribosomal protein L19e [Methanohalophilus halophilus]RNI09693.1 50S ribosomal protein L19e [Methanohalophilus halophilus]SDW53085.1 LSU ribosomal protein L19E [Methanohalophilus halophilus]